MFTIVLKNVNHVNFLFSSGFYQNVKTIVLNAPKLFYYGNLDENFVTTHYNKVYIQSKIKFGTGHLIVFNSGVQVWKKNKIFGGGLKSFRLNCSNKPHYQICTTHPHNYLLEILTDTGLLGFVLFYSIIILAIFNYLKFYFSVIDAESRLISVPFFFIILFEFFPLRSTGSFFTTSNATVIFLMLAFLFNANKLKQCKMKKDGQKK